MKKSNRWELQDAQPAIDLGILNIQYHFYKNPRNEKVVKTVSIQGQDAVNVIPLTKDRKVILVKQFRFGIGDYTWEIPGGMIDAGEAPAIAVQRELREETGYAGSDWEYLGKIQSNPVFMNSYVHHFLARNVTCQFEMELDEAEQVELVPVEITKVYEWINNGVIQHPHTITAFYFARSLLVKQGG